MAGNRSSLAEIENDVNKIGTRYTVRDPHPGYGVDPNIINEVGHTHYPKWIDHPTEKEVHRTTTYIGRDQVRSNTIQTEFPVKVRVNSKEEEDKLLGKATKKATAWTKE